MRKGATTRRRRLARGERVGRRGKPRRRRAIGVQGGQIELQESPVRFLVGVHGAGEIRGEGRFPALERSRVAARDAILESKACAKFACERYKYGGVVGAHVAVWAALNPDQETPKMVDEIHAAKTEAILRRVKREIKDRRAIMRIEGDAKLPDIDEEAAARLVEVCTNAVREALSAHQLTHTSARMAGAPEGRGKTREGRRQARAALERRRLSCERRGCRSTIQTRWISPGRSASRRPGGVRREGGGTHVGNV